MNRLNRYTKLIGITCIVSALAATQCVADARDDAAAYFKSTEEPGVKDAAWTTPKTFKVGVLDNGRSRNGYAMYVCEVLRERGLHRGTWVHVIDIANLVKTNKWVKLGDHRCK